MQRIIILFNALCLVFLMLFCHSTVKVTETKPAKEKPKTECELSEMLRKIHHKKVLDTARHFKEWLKQHHYNTHYMMVADMGLSMEHKRFFLVNLNADSIEYSSLVAHGSGGGSSTCNVATSNKPGSHCTSLGRYKVGDSLWGEYGKGFRLHGLDTCNSNAYQRLIVIHYYSRMPCEENEYPIYYSEGCPMMCRRDFYVYNKYIKSSTKPMLLIMYK